MYTFSLSLLYLLGVHGCLYYDGVGSFCCYVSTPTALPYMGP
jgi:hypothetical protein